MLNHILLTAYIFNNTGNVYLRTEDIVVPLPAKFLPCTSPLGDASIKTKIIYGSDYDKIAYVEESVEQLYALIASPFETGNLEEMYPNETPEQIKTRRLSNWDILKTLVNQKKVTGEILYLANSRIEFYRPLNDKISISNGHSVPMFGHGNTSMVFYPFIFRAETSDHTPFQMDYGSSIDVRDLNIKCGQKQGKLETYDVILKKNGNARLIELQGTIRPSFWTDLAIGNTVYCSWDSSVLSDQRVVASFDSVAKTITLTSDITASVASDTPGDFGRHFTNDLISELDYNTYGQFWIWASGSPNGASAIRCIPAANSGAEISFNFENVNIENFWTGLDISAGNFHVNFKDLTFTDCGVALGAFARSQLNGQYISGDNMTFIRNGYQCIAQITADNSLIYGSGGYIHPTIILTISNQLTLLNNTASAFRQFSSTVEVVQVDVESYVNRIVASGSSEYDFYSSNCHPVTIDYFEGDELWIGGTIVVNSGEVRQVVSGSSNSQPPNGTPVDWTFNNMEFTGQITCSFNSLTEDVHDTVFNDCIFYVQDYTVKPVMMNIHQNARSIEFNNCEIKKAPTSTVPTYTPGEAAPAGEKCTYLTYAQGRLITFNNLITEYLKGGLFLEATNLIRTPPYSNNKIHINDSEINFSHLMNNAPSIASFWRTDQINGNRSKIQAFNYGGLGYNTPFAFTSKVASKLNVNILTASQTYINQGGSFSGFGSFAISNVLEIDLDHDEYYVNAGTIKRITLPTWAGASKVVSESIYIDIITIHAVGGDVVITGWDATTNEYGNVDGSVTIPSGTSKSFACDNKRVLSKSANSVVNATIATGNGSTKEYKGLLSDYLIAPQNFSIVAGAVVGTADVDGNITGSGIDPKSFVDYGTGTYYVLFDVNVGNTVPIDVEYEKYVNWRATGVFSEV